MRRDVGRSVCSPPLSAFLGHLNLQRSICRWVSRTSRRAYEPIPFSWPCHHRSPPPPHKALFAASIPSASAASWATALLWSKASPNAVRAKRLTTLRRLYSSPRLVLVLDTFKLLRPALLSNPAPQPLDWVNRTLTSGFRILAPSFLLLASCSSLWLPAPDS
jgi:hypothetical protein